jgi:hypothetical protein
VGCVDASSAIGYLAQTLFKRSVEHASLEREMINNGWRMNFRLTKTSHDGNLSADSKLAQSYRKYGGITGTLKVHRNIFASL